MSRKIKKKGSMSLYHNVFFLLIVLAIIVISMASFTLFRSEPASVSRTSIIPSRQVLIEVASNLNIKPTIRESNYFDWKMQDGSRMPLSGYTFFLGTINTKDIEGFEDIDPENIDTITPQFVNEFQENADSIFESIGFTKDELNSSNVPNEFNTVYNGYMKNNIYCFSQISYYSDPFAYIFCGISDNSQLIKQKEFLNLFDESSYNGPNALLRVDKVVGDFATGSTSDGMGYVWIAKKEDGGWNIISRTTEPPRCSDMEEYGVPKQIYMTCYNE